MRYFSTASLARLSARHPGKTFSIWIVLLILAGVMFGTIGIPTTTRLGETGSP